jgi:quinol monooxygenase YgiN
MILVTGEILANAATVDLLVAAGLEHVHRSRTEPGCLAHHLHVDVENPHRLVFVERWADRATLDEHFRQPGSIEFVTQLRTLANGRPRMEIFTVPDA